MKGKLGAKRAWRIIWPGLVVILIGALMSSLRYAGAGDGWLTFADVVLFIGWGITLVGLVFLIVVGFVTVATRGE